MSAGAQCRRRNFLRQGLQVTALAGGGMLLGLQLPLARAVSPKAAGAAAATATVTAAATAVSPSPAFAPNAFLRVGADDMVTIELPAVEMGQGVYTALPLLVAEELDADWSRVRVEMAQADPAYANPSLGYQATLASTSVRAFWLPLRQAGASARALLVSAAAQAWKVKEQECRTQGGAVHHRSGRSLRYGALAAAAARLPLPSGVSLKSPRQFRLLGKGGLRSLDGADKVRGRATFGMDVRLPGMLTALIARPPTLGAEADHWDAAAALAVSGVHKVHALRSGVAVLAEGFWPAWQGREALRTTWKPGPQALLGTDDLHRQLGAGLVDAGRAAREEGNALGPLAARGARLVDVSYAVPFLPHACMEPLNCTVSVGAGKVEVWGGVQAAGRVQQVLGERYGCGPGGVSVHPCFMGGGSGRRFALDAVLDAAELSAAAGVPVQLVYTREDDTRAQYYRPAARARLRAALDPQGLPLALHAHVASPSPRTAAGLALDQGLDPGALEGLSEWPYRTEHVKIEWSRVDLPVLPGFWRGGGHSSNTWFAESFVDELAATAGRDPLAYRRELLAGAPRLRAVLDLLAQKAGWDKPLPTGIHRGLAVCESFGSCTAQLVELTVERDSRLRIHRVVCVADCGQVVDPDNVRRLMQGAVIQGLAAALGGQITVKDGAIEQGSLDSLALPRLTDVPPIEVHLLVREGEPPGGASESGLPCLAPALTNAIFAATGVRLRRLPVAGQKLTRS
jgi:isoquinoline 1-oxidoreductase beta subunit